MPAAIAMTQPEAQVINVTWRRGDWWPGFSFALAVNGTQLDFDACGVRCEFRRTGQPDGPRTAVWSKGAGLSTTVKDGKSHLVVDGQAFPAALDAGEYTAEIEVTPPTNVAGAPVTPVILNVVLTADGSHG